MKVSKGRGSKDKNEAILDTVEEDRKGAAAGKRKAVGKVSESSNSGKRRMGSINNIEKQSSAKDPNKPKRPASAFFVFLEEFRKVYKEEHPNVKAVSAVGKAGGEKWKSLSSEEKAPYEAKAAKRKSDYQKLMNAYNKKQMESVDADDDDDDDDDDDEEDDKPNKSLKKPKANGAKDDDGADSEEEDDDDDDDDEEDD